MPDAKLCWRGSENLSTLHRRVASLGESAPVRLNLGRKPPKNALPFGMNRRNDLYGLQGQHHAGQFAGGGDGAQGTRGFARVWGELKFDAVEAVMRDS